MTENGSKWQEWSKFVLYQIEACSDEIRELREKLMKVNVEIAVLKVKASIWGAAGGAIPVAIALVIWLLKRSIG